ncbi:MAG: hypothetical protein V1775_03500 [Bacteroidota bacterium]
MEKLFVLAFAVVIFYSCSNSTKTPSTNGASTDQTDQKQLVIENDMESAASLISGWINEVTVVKMEKVKAHSGELVSKVDDINLYSYTYREQFENINEKLPTRVVVNGWFYLPEVNEKAAMVMDINENNETYIWKAYDLMDENPALNQWNEFTAYFTIDQPIKPGHQIKLFGFGGKKVAYFDDIKITFEY